MYPVTANTPNSDTGTYSDSDVTRKILDHIDAQVHEIGQQVSELVKVLDEWRPVLAMLRAPGGKPDMIGLATIRRRTRRGT